MASMLRSQKFRTEREAEWRRLEHLLDLYEAGRKRQLSDDDVVSIPVLYRSALSSLSAARAVSLDQNLIAYLESLCTRAYFCVYGSRASFVERITRYLLRDWRNAVRGLWRETIVAFAFGILGVAIAFWLVSSGAEWFYAFVPEGLAQGRDPGASTKDLQQAIAQSHGANGLAFFSSFLFTHNAQMALLAFALGFACCLPTAFFLFYNGLMLGAMIAVYAGHGLGIPFGGWLFVHGVTELFAITLAGAGGFRIGWALAFPGELSRLDALRSAGKDATLVMIGVVVMLLVAGLLEGFARQLIGSTELRYAIGAMTGLFWLAYFYFPVRNDGRGRAD
ncbi:MAG TPA: stage II sporulation protein M [Rhizomicrobium sp.]|nr:stage II sporulation protein M [Rhizomicrobium sp.]